MQAEPNLDFPAIACGLANRGIRFLVIGRQALLLYGAPVLTFDYDLWVHPDDRTNLYDWLVGEIGFEASRDRDDPVPILTIHAGIRKLDLFFYRGVRDRTGIDLSFDEAFAASVEFRDPAAPEFRIRAPSPDHMIVLKRLRPPNLKDDEDIRYLQAIRDEPL